MLATPESKDALSPFLHFNAIETAEPSDLHSGASRGEASSTDAPSCSRTSV